MIVPPNSIELPANTTKASAVKARGGCATVSIERVKNPEKSSLNQLLSTAVVMTGEGFEPSTHGLKGRGPEFQATSKQVVTGVETNACSNACSNLPESTQGGTFGEALAMISRLPLSDADKADAVRRLLMASTPSDK